MSKPDRLINVDHWSVGVDPGFQGTGLVLMADGDPVAAAAAQNTSRKPLPQRTRTMGLWFYEVLQDWIDKYEIPMLYVVIELAFLNDKTRNVTTLATQMKMHGVYVDKLYDLGGCEVWYGEVTNSTSKKVFTGFGNASKDIMIANSVWARRPDLGDMREHLADAQAHGMCYPKMIPILVDTLPQVAKHEDGNIGAGPLWKGKIK